MQPYQQRVAEEAEQLDEKICKLKAFLSDKKASNIRIVERDLLHQQLSTMQEYLGILHQRIRLFEP